MKRLLVVLFGVLVFESSATAELPDVLQLDGSTGCTISGGGILGGGYPPAPGISDSDGFWFVCNILKRKKRSGVTRNKLYWSHRFGFSQVGRDAFITACKERCASGLADAGDEKCMGFNLAMNPNGMPKYCSFSPEVRLLSFDDKLYPLVDIYEDESDDFRFAPSRSTHFFQLSCDDGEPWPLLDSLGNSVCKRQGKSACWDRDRPIFGSTQNPWVVGEVERSHNHQSVHNPRKYRDCFNVCADNNSCYRDDQWMFGRVRVPESHCELPRGTVRRWNWRVMSDVGDIRDIVQQYCEGDTCTLPFENSYGRRMIDIFLSQTYAVWEFPDDPGRLHGGRHDSWHWPAWMAHCD